MDKALAHYELQQNGPSRMGFLFLQRFVNRLLGRFYHEPEDMSKEISSLLRDKVAGLVLLFPAFMIADNWLEMFIGEPHGFSEEGNRRMEAMMLYFIHEIIRKSA